MPADLVDLHDVGVLQPCHRLAFGEEADHVFGRSVRAAEDHLQGDVASQANLPRLVDDAHAAAAQHLEDLIAGHGRPFGG